DIARPVGQPDRDRDQDGQLEGVDQEPRHGAFGGWVSAGLAPASPAAAPFPAARRCTARDDRLCSADSADSRASAWARQPAMAEAAGPVSAFTASTAPARSP